MAHTSPNKAKGTLTVRTGASRSLLVKKAIERIRTADQGQGVEATFPTSPTSSVPEVTASNPPESLPAGRSKLTVEGQGLASPDDGTQTELTAPVEAGSAIAGHLPPSPGKLSRTTSGTCTIITLGNIKPNPGTLFDVIAGIVSEQGSISRADLLAAMAKTTFPQPKARPDDRGWCQGYVAGAIRSGFLSVAQSPVDKTEPATSSAEA